jgi:hypothetical protein
MGEVTRTRRRRAGAVTLLVVTGVGAAVACDPNGLDAATVSYTTDRMATHELGRHGVDIRRLTCQAKGPGDRTPSPSPGATAVATVDCRGETTDGRGITVTGRITRAVNGQCVRGNLVARVGTREVFRVSGLGDCDAGPSAPAATYRPPDGPQPTVTVTVTKTLWCQTSPGCWPRGK